MKTRAEISELESRKQKEKNQWNKDRADSLNTSINLINLRNTEKEKKRHKIAISWMNQGILWQIMKMPEGWENPPSSFIHTYLTT